MFNKTETLAIKISAKEMAELDRAWKRMENIPNRSQFVKHAINAYAGVVVCDVKQTKIYDNKEVKE